MSDMGIVIVGLHHLHSVGWVQTIEQVHGVRVVAVVDEDEALLAETASALSLPGYTQLNEALARPEVDIALILLPHCDCPAAAVQAAQAGKHVIVEKPCAVSADVWRDALARIEEVGVQCAVPFVWRRHPLVTEMMSIIRSGDIGLPIYCSGNIIGGPPTRYTTGPSPWMIDKRLSGGGALHNLGVHFIDLFNWLLGQKPDRVTAQVSSAMHGLEVEDYARILLWYPGGECASIETGYSLPGSYPPSGYDFSVCIKGCGGSIEWSTCDNEIIVATDLPHARHAPVRREHVAYPTPPGYIGLPSLLFMEEIVGALRNHQKVPIRGRDALAALEIVEAAYRAADKGKVVEL